jgi:ATP-dependent RNA helicase SUPV3L1/SUV3
LWRQARFERHGGAHRRPDHRRHGGQRQAASQEGGAPAGERPAQEGRPGERPRYQGRRDGGEGAARPEGKPKFNRDRYKGPPKPPGEGGRPDFRQGKPQGEGGRPDRREGRGQDGKPDRGPKPAFQPRQREERPAQVDPLSPFAKLAALRDQLQPKK